MGEGILILFQIGIPVGLLVLGLFIGRYNEQKHYRSIHERERIFLHVPATSIKEVPDPGKVEDARLVTGCVVVSIDYFKQFVAGLRKIFGGELRTYSSLLDRARREATLRMKESYPDADAYVNCRLETTSISKGQRKTIGSVEVLAYGTAVKYRK